MSFNRIFIVGNLGRDPELRYTSTGTAVANFSVATNSRFKKDGEQQERTSWFRAVAFGKLAETASQYLQKGSKVVVIGEVSLDEYEDRDGNKRSALEVRANDIQFLDAKKADDSTGPSDKPADAVAGDDGIPF